MIVERLDRARHDTARFTCGRPELDAYLNERLPRDEDDRTAVAYVLVDPDDPAMPRRVVGYFTINSFAMPNQQARRRDRQTLLGGYNPVPAALIGRLALDVDYQGRAVGIALLMAALNRVVAIREQLGIAAVVVHALDEGAAAFFVRHGFTRFRDEPNHLYYPLATFEAVLTVAE